MSTETFWQMLCSFSSYQCFETSGRCCEVWLFSTDTAAADDSSTNLWLPPEALVYRLEQHHCLQTAIKERLQCLLGATNSETIKWALFPSRKVLGNSKLKKKKMWRECLKPVCHSLQAVKIPGTCSACRHLQNINHRNFALVIFILGSKSEQGNLPLNICKWGQ